MCIDDCVTGIWDSTPTLIKSKKLHSGYDGHSLRDLRALTKKSQTIAEGKAITGDLGGKASTQEYTAAIIGKL